MIVDAHMHIWRKVDGRIGGKIPVRPLGQGMIAIGKSRMLGMPAWMGDCAALAEHVVAEFDAAGVDVGVVVQEYMDGQQNAYVRSAAKRFPGRFFMHGLPDYFRFQSVARQAFHLLDQGFAGLKLPAGHLAAAGIALDHEAFLPIYARMEDQQAVLAVDLSEGQGQVGMMENILRRHPRLPVAVGHFGMVNRGGWPGQLLLCRHRHVHMESGGIIWLYRGEGYPFPSAIKAVRRAADKVGMEKLMWGSDWPRTMVDFTYRQSLQFVRETKGLTDPEKAAFLGDNAARLYRLKRPQRPRQPAPLVTEG